MLLNFKKKSKKNWPKKWESMILKYSKININNLMKKRIKKREKS